MCIPPPPPNLNCDDVEASNFEVVGSDPHGFDGDNDGVGCEDGDGEASDGGISSRGDRFAGDDYDGDDDDGANDDNGDDDGADGNEGEGNSNQNEPNEFEGCVVPPGRDPGDVGC